MLINLLDGRYNCSERINPLDNTPDQIVVSNNKIVCGYSQQDKCAIKKTDCEVYQQSRYSPVSQTLPKCTDESPKRVPPFGETAC
ncbi:MAG: hypothetical protein AABW47_03640 [Nanoarchaeota archaeon]